MSRSKFYRGDRLPPILHDENPGWSLDKLAVLLKEAVNESLLLAAKERGIYDSIPVLLSGGLDSSLMLALAVQAEHGEQCRAFTLIGGPNHPDLVAALEVSRRYDVPHTVFRPSRAEIKYANARLEEFGFAAASIDEGMRGAYLIDFNLNGWECGTALLADAADELFGGYWPHRQFDEPVKTQQAFEDNWRALYQRHIKPFDRLAQMMDITLIRPFLYKPLVDYVTTIPLCDRTSKAESKIPLRKIARQLGVPESVIARPKRGFCDCLKTE